MRTYRITYNVHCKTVVYYDKEMIVKNCKDEWDAQYKLSDYCKRKYSPDGFIKIEYRTIFNELNLQPFANDDTYASKAKSDAFMEMFKDLITPKK